MSKLTKEMLIKQAKAVNMDFEDYLCYYIKELRQQYDYWSLKNYKHLNIAKIRARGLLNKLRDAQDIQYLLHQGE